MKELLTRSTAPQAIQFFYYCFRRGVIDASGYDDSIDMRDFYNKKTADWSFGTLEHPDDMDWAAFRSQLYWWARQAGYKTLAESYLFRIRNKNYTWCILPYCMRFYLLGIAEWLAYPNPGKIELFKAAKKTHWDPNSEVRTFTRIDIISYLHTFEFEYKSKNDDELEIPKLAMATFSSALYDLSQKYGRKKKKGV